MARRFHDYIRIADVSRVTTCLIDNRFTQKFHLFSKKMKLQYYFSAIVILTMIPAIVQAARKGGQFWRVRSIGAQPQELDIKYSDIHQHRTVRFQWNKNQVGPKDIVRMMNLQLRISCITDKSVFPIIHIPVEGFMMKTHDIDYPTDDIIESCSSPNKYVFEMTAKYGESLEFTKVYPSKSGQYQVIPETEQEKLARIQKNRLQVIADKIKK